MLFYSLMVAVLALVTTNLSVQIIEARNIQEINNKLQENINDTKLYLETAIRGASSIDLAASTFDDSTGELTLNMVDGGIDPAHFYIDGGNLFYEEGLSSPIQLNTSNTEIDEFTISQTTYPQAPDHLSFTIIFSALGNQINSQASQNLNISYSLNSY